MINLLSPEIVVIGGGVAGRWAKVSASAYGKSPYATRFREPLRTSAVSQPRSKTIPALWARRCSLAIARLRRNNRIRRESCMNADWKNRYEEGVLAAQEAGRIALGYFDTAVAVETKSDQSPVTIADRSAEQALRTRLHRAFPDDGFLGEEFGDTPGTSGYRWIIDPIDGTRSFIRGIPIWATLVGLEYRSEMIAGIAYNPVWNQTHRALRGDGAYRDERRIRVSDEPALAKSLLSYSSYGFFKAAGRQNTFTQLLASTERSRGYADYYGFVLVAQGSIELMADHGVHLWDVAGLQVIVEEAGGQLTDWHGKRDLERPDVLASNGKVHAAALEILAR